MWNREKGDMEIPEFFCLYGNSNDMMDKYCSNEYITNLKTTNVNWNTFFG
jgi:hypothetical protein